MTEAYLKAKANAIKIQRSISNIIWLDGRENYRNFIKLISKSLYISATEISLFNIFGTSEPSHKDIYDLKTALKSYLCIAFKREVDLATIKYLKPYAKKEILKIVLKLGGTLSGEHGIGLTKRSFISWQVEPDVLMAMRQIKKVFDPYNIMNPGKGY